jgi:hypothetical protein
VISPIKGDNPALFGEITGDFDSILHGLGAAIGKEGLLGEIPGDNVVQLFSQSNIWLVHHQVEAGMDEFTRLIPYGLDHRVGTMTHVQDPYPASKIDVLSSGHVLYPSPFGLGYDEGSHVEYSPWNKFLSIADQFLRVIR